MEERGEEAAALLANMREVIYAGSKLKKCTWRMEGAGGGHVKGRQPTALYFNFLDSASTNEENCCNLWLRLLDVFTCFFFPLPTLKTETKKVINTLLTLENKPIHGC